MYISPRAPPAPNVFPLWVAVAALALLSAAGLGTGLAGLVRTFTAIPKIPARVPPSWTVRPVAPNFMDAFFYLNESAPNPSYINFLTAPGPSISTVFRNEGGNFDTSDPAFTIARAAGVYALSLQLSVLAPPPFDPTPEVAIVLTNTTGPTLGEPVIMGMIERLLNSTLIGNGVAVLSQTMTMHLEANTPLYVAYNTTGPAIVTPGGFVSFLLIDAD